MVIRSVAKSVKLQHTQYAKNDQVNNTNRKDTKIFTWLSNCVAEYVYDSNEDSTRVTI